MSFDRDPGYESNLPRPVYTAAGSESRGPSIGGSNLSDDTQRRLEAALHSPFGIEKLLNRLKQSIYSSREFSGFLKERCALEDRYAQGFKKLVRHASDSIYHPQARQGSYARHFDESLRINERLAENGLQFASSLQSMVDELNLMADNAERGRKHWKHTTVDAEKRLADAEDAQLKAKNRYSTAAEQYDRVRTGEKQSGMLGFKNKSLAQQEEALKEKADMLDQDYTSKTQAAREQRRDFESATKPQIVRGLQDLVLEVDAALAMQMAKLASLSEKHIVSNGMAIAPLGSADATGREARGLRHIAADIDDRKDFHDYMLDGAEPPPQFKGRSRRNTDAEPVHTPVQSTYNVDQQGPSYDAPLPYNGTQSQVESQPPQLPQIGGQDSFSRSFETERPTPQNRNSYLTGQPDALYKSSTNQSQLSGTTSGPVPPLPVGRGMSTGPTSQIYDRAQQSSIGGYTESDSQDQSFTSQPISRQDTLPSTGPPRYDTTVPAGFAGPAPPRQNTMGTTDFSKQGPPRHDTMGPSIVASQGPPKYETTGSAGFAAQGPARQDTYGRTVSGNQGLPTQDTVGPVGYGSQGPPRQNTFGTTNDRGQSPMNNGSAPSMGRSQPAPGSYMDPGRSQGPYGNLGTAGRVQQPLTQRSLPSQQPARPTLPPNNPVFGLHLDELFRRDGSAVPTIVFQCIQAVDTFGLRTEGIYRISGSTPTVMQLKSEFDHDSSLVTLNEPSAFGDDIAVVATLLKNFLRDMPDSLLTNAAYDGFIQAAKYEDNILRRDSMHQYINTLPDPNYATLRVLVLHLHRVATNSDINKMDMRNLAIVFGPTVMGGSNVADAGWQTKVMETILHHTHDIFDPDE